MSIVTTTSSLPKWPNREDGDSSGGGGELRGWRDKAEDARAYDFLADQRGRDGRGNARAVVVVVFYLMGW